jgi:hypothetical protein
MASQQIGSDFTGGSRMPTYANGRVLLAEDLTASQSGLRARDVRIGEAAGAGVVRGMWVTSTDTTLTVAPGLGSAASGASVVVSGQVTLPLTSSGLIQDTSGAVFGCCEGDGVGAEQTSLSSGLLLLTVRPACRDEGGLPTAPPPGGSVSSGCAARWQVEGVEFRAITLPVPTTVAGVDVTSGNRRSLVAHWCLGTEQLLRFAQDPFGFDPAYAGLDQLAPEDLTACDVPLATFAWDGTQVSDLDNWSARRRVTRTSPVSSPWTVAVADRRVAEGEARFLQFQDQAEELVDRAKAGSAVAEDYFGLLPPVGFLPVGNADLLALSKRQVRRKVQEDRAAEPELMTEKEVRDAAAEMWMARRAPLDESGEGGQRLHRSTEENKAFFSELVKTAQASYGYGFDPETFFGNLALPGGILDWNLVEFALQQSWRARAVPTRTADLAPEDRKLAQRRYPFTYYYVLQNLVAAQTVGQELRSRLGRKVQRNRYLGSANLYVVFIANQLWVGETRPPFIELDTFGRLATAWMATDFQPV